MNVVLQHWPDDHPRRTFSAGDVRRMVEAGIVGEDERIELIEGDLIMMAAKGLAHEIIKSALVKALNRAASDDLVVGVEMTIELAANVLVEPDIAVFKTFGFEAIGGRVCSSGRPLLAAVDRGRVIQPGI